MNRLFTYGTLRDPHQFARVVGVDPYERQVGERQLQGYRLAGLGRASYLPTILESDDSRVVGTLYEVTDQDFIRLDRYEGVPTLYRRTKVELEDGPAYVYIGNAYV